MPANPWVERWLLSRKGRCASLPKTMNEYVDLHCHYVPGVDDGARSLQDADLMLTGLGRLGFCHVVATPHMRPGLFDNSAADLRKAFAEVEQSFKDRPDIPGLSLSAEHYFDDVVFSRILSDQALPYPTGKAILLEFYDSEFPHSIDQRLADICRKGMTPIIAHPERYQPIDRRPEILERLLDLGAAALLDIGAVVGKYGRRAKHTAEALLERGLYRATCSDAHSPKDLQEVARGIEWIRRKYGDEEVTELLATGPRALMAYPEQPEL
jgi:protein-tyrosine phosphatase